MESNLLIWTRIRLPLLLLALLGGTVLMAEGFRLAQIYDAYPWTSCNSFESTKKNCPIGEACLKLKTYKEYAWNWAMRCQSREEYIEKFEFNLLN